METENRPHVDKTQKSLAMLAIMRRIEEKRKKRSRRRPAAPRIEVSRPVEPVLQA